MTKLMKRLALCLAMTAAFALALVLCGTALAAEPGENAVSMLWACGCESENHGVRIVWKARVYSEDHGAGSFVLSFRKPGEETPVCELEASSVCMEAFDGAAANEYQCSYSIERLDWFCHENGLTERMNYEVSVTHRADGALDNEGRPLQDSNTIRCEFYAPGIYTVLFTQVTNGFLEWDCVEPEEGVWYTIHLSRSDGRFYIIKIDPRDEKITCVMGLYRWPLDFKSGELRQVPPGEYRVSVYQSMDTASGERINGACREPGGLVIPLDTPAGPAYRDGAVSWRGRDFSLDESCAYEVSVYSGAALEGMAKGEKIASGRIGGDSWYHDAGNGEKEYWVGLGTLGITGLTEGNTYCFTVRAVGTDQNPYYESEESEAVTFLHKFPVQPKVTFAALAEKTLGGGPSGASLTLSLTIDNGGSAGEIVVWAVLYDEAGKFLGLREQTLALEQGEKTYDLGALTFSGVDRGTVGGYRAFLTDAAASPLYAGL